LGGGGYQEINFEDLFSGGAGGAQPPGGFSDVFGDLFGRARRGRAAAPTRGQDVESEITIDFMSAVRGATLELHPQGVTGSTTATPVTVRIPAGAAEGSRVRIAGHGGQGAAGAPRGDLILTIHVTPHPFFKREGDDLHLDLPITISEAHRGAKVRVPTIDGAVTMKVPERTQSGNVMRLRGKGVAKKGKTAGDLYVHFMVHVPTARSKELDDLVEKIAAFEQEDVRRDMRDVKL
jgi:curved DNA-binding protein